MKLLVSLKSEPEKKEIIKTPRSVTVIAVNPRSKVMTIEAFGTVVPRLSVKLAVEVSGRILELHPSFVEGGRVEKGDLLVRIDPDSYRLEYDAAQVRISQAMADIDNLVQDTANLEKDIELSRANLKLVEKELSRVRKLTENQFASQNSRDLAEQNMLQARMQLQSLENRLALNHTGMKTRKAALAMAEVDFRKAGLALDRTKIRADFTGFILDKQAEKGEFVNPGQVLGVIYQKGSLDVTVRIPIEKSRWFKSRISGHLKPEVRITLAGGNDGPSRTWKGRVARVQARIDEQTRTLPLTVEIETSDQPAGFLSDLKPGSFVRCEIIGETRDEVYVLPRHLLKTGDILYLVKDGLLVMQKVVPLRKFEDEVYITRGLAPGDQVVSSPLPGALDGMELTIKKDGE